MIGKIKTVPEKAAFTIGLSLILFVPLFLFLVSVLFPLENWTKMIISSIAIFLSTLFILSAADKRHSRIGKGK
ncbi:hypothetical protein JOC95_001868 [Bacillus tianshenii]|uniref:Uncharacterized protein n=1 Tax=Sutcliffiella tianshenii TaxID=1463404 RepID=A0ABS2NZF5_9BACI|nr:hypothetical protein [Bacillus tianshenii]MBM7620016.1 hypothetical protein [Bacillus tianshenii]